MWNGLRGPRDFQRSCLGVDASEVEAECRNEQSAGSDLDKTSTSRRHSVTSFSYLLLR